MKPGGVLVTFMNLLYAERSSELSEVSEFLRDSDFEKLIRLKREISIHTVQYVLIFNSKSFHWKVLIQGGVDNEWSNNMCENLFI